MTCAGTTKAGTPCQATILDADGFCARHGERVEAAPAVFDEARRAAFLDKIAEGRSLEGAAMDVGLTRSALWHILAVDPAFDAQVQSAEELACGPVEEALYGAARSGRDIRASELWLINRAPRRWRAKQGANAISITAGAGSTVAIGDQTPADQIAQIMELARQRQALALPEAEVIEAEVIDDPAS
jgi:hypothetical protein